MLFTISNGSHAPSVSVCFHKMAAREVCLSCFVPRKNICDKKNTFWHLWLFGQTEWGCLIKVKQFALASSINIMLLATLHVMPEHSQPGCYCSVFLENIAFE